MTADKIINRVKALLAQAQHPRTPPAEAQAAAAKAAELMIRHAITEAALRADTGKPPEPVERLDYPVAGTGGHGKARVAALAAVTRAYGCKNAVLGNDASNGPRTLEIIGTRSALSALRVLLPSIEMQMEMASRAATRDYRQQLRWAAAWQSPAELRKLTAGFYRDYLRGYGYGVADKINTTWCEVAKETAGTSTALVLANDATRIQAEFTRQFPKLGKSRPERKRHPGALTEGRRAGHHADLGSHHLGGDRPQLTEGQ